MRETPVLPLHEEIDAPCVRVAEPCYDGYLVEALKMATEEGLLERLGPVYGKDKSQFWKMTDAFVFPTQNEAEPLVLWEAPAAGVPIFPMTEVAFFRSLKPGALQ